MIYFLIALGVLIFDQVTKYFVRAEFALYESKAIIEDFFHLTYIENPGAAFGILANQRWFFIVATALIIVFIIFFMISMEKEEPKANLFLAMAVGGAVGNFIDRLMKGTVTDFFDFKVWPIFNIADSFIVVGMIVASFYVLKGEKKWIMKN